MAEPTRAPDSLSGLIERVTFHNEDNGWAVLKVKAKGHRDLVSVVVSLASVNHQIHEVTPAAWAKQQKQKAQPLAA